MKRMSVLLLVLVLAAGILAGCTEAAVQTQNFTDREGNTFELAGKPEKIISTAPSNTKVLSALGLGSKIIGISKYDKPDATISEDVLVIDFKAPDIEAILAMEPDLILASGHNRTGDDDPFRLLKEAGVSIAYLPSSETVESIYDDVAFIASVTGTGEKGQEIVDSMKVEVEKIKVLAAQVTEKKRVYFEISPDPYLYTTGTGTFQHDIIELIGAENVYADQVSWFAPSVESIIEVNPDVIVTNVNYVEDAVGAIKSRPGFDVIKAVENSEVYLIDADLTSQPAPQVVEALWEMGRLVYPEIFNQ